MGMFHTSRDSQRRIAGTCAGQSRRGKVGTAFKRDNPEPMHFPADIVAAAACGEGLFEERKLAYRGSLDRNDRGL